MASRNVNAYRITDGLNTISAAGNSQATGTAVTGNYVLVDSADGTKGVTLGIPYGDETGVPIIVVNTDATNNLKVYPWTGAAIDGGSTNAAVTLVPLELRVFYAFSLTVCYSQTVPSGVTTATAGTVTASKAVVVDASKDVTGFRLVGLDEINITNVATPAAAGSAQGDAQLITAHRSCQAVTGADGTTGVVLPATGTGVVWIYNNAASLLKVYPGTGDTINAGAANANVEIPPKQLMFFIPLSASAWATSQFTDIVNAQTVAGVKTFSGNNVHSGTMSLTGATVTQTSSNAAALVSGRQGATNPGFNVDNSTGSCVTGVTVKAGATGTGVDITATGSATDEDLRINPKGAGKCNIGKLSTGLTVMGRGSLKTPVMGNTKTTGNAQNVTPTAAELLGGLYSHNSQTGAGTVTLDTAANIDTAIGADVATGDSFECYYHNVGNQTATITTNTGLTLKGATVDIVTLKGALLKFVKTGVAAWDVYILAGA